MLDEAPESAVRNRVKANIAGHPFEAEGPPEIVLQQYQLYVEAVKEALRVGAAGILPGDEGAAGNGMPPAAEPETAMGRVFRVSSDLVSLKRVPQTKQKNTDALVLLLYGFSMLLEQDRVLGTKLMKAAKATGLRIDRVDRFLIMCKEYVTTEGERRGKRYALNAQGIGHAERLLEGLAD